MSMYSCVQGGKPADEEYKQMAAVWEACENADIDIPEEVKKFFSYKEPGGNTMWSDIDECVKEYSNDAEESWIVDLSKLPEGVKLIKFTNSY